MGIGKSKITSSINVDDMLKKAESNHELEAEKQDADKRLTEIREAKEALLKIHRDLLDAIKAEGEAAVILQEAISSSNNIINGIYNAIVKAEQNTQFKATIKSEHLAQLQQLVSVSAILSCRPFFILIFLLCIKMKHYGFSRKSIWKNLETFP